MAYRLESLEPVSLDEIEKVILGVMEKEEKAKPEERKFGKLRVGWSWKEFPKILALIGIGVSIEEARKVGEKIIDYRYP